MPTACSRVYSGVPLFRTARLEGWPLISEVELAFPDNWYRGAQTDERECIDMECGGVEWSRTFRIAEIWRWVQWPGASLLQWNGSEEGMGVKKEWEWRRCVAYKINVVCMHARTCMPAPKMNNNILINMALSLCSRISSRLYMDLFQKAVDRGSPTIWGCWTTVS